MATAMNRAKSPEQGAKRCDVDASSPKTTASSSPSLATTVGDEPVVGLPIAVPALLIPTKEVNLESWSVIAVDQYTSEPEYWQKVAAKVGQAPSLLHCVFPEVHLSSVSGGSAADDEKRIRSICQTTEKYAGGKLFQERPPAYVAVERDTPFAKSRKGLVVAVDLDHYDWKQGSTPLIRPTEKTIPERLPPRIAIRKDAHLEVTHVIMLIDDAKKTVLEPLWAKEGMLEPEYDVDLMMDAGRLRGSTVTPAGAQHLEDTLRALMPDDGPLFMVGDGNHSLATAKACWDAAKADAQPDDPRRYALVEVENLHDPAVRFEPIHRVLFGADQKAVLAQLTAAWGPPAQFTDPMSPKSRGAHDVVAVLPDGTCYKFCAPGPTMAVVPTSEQLDKWVDAHPESTLDFVHGDQAVKDALGPNDMGFLLPTIDRSAFVETLRMGGVMPRKSFSMGDAEEKRFYMEARRIR